MDDDSGERLGGPVRAPAFAGPGRPEEEKLSASPDPGLDAVRFVYEHMKIGPEWSVRDERGFTWWGLRLAQRVWAEHPIQEEGRTVCRVHAEADFLRSFPDDDVSIALIGETARRATLSGLVPRENGALRFWSSACVDEANYAWVRHVFSASVALAACEAEDSADAMGFSLRAHPEISAHPESGRRAERDDMLNLARALPETDATHPGWIDQSEFVAIGDEIIGRAGCLPTVEPLSLRAEIPFGPRGGYSASGGVFSRLEVSTRECHPRIGCGALLRLHLPFRLGFEEQARLALDLNLLERSSYPRCHSFGSWCPDRGPGPVYAAFAPATLRQEDLLLGLVRSMIARAQWIAWRYETNAELRARLGEPRP